MYNLLVGAEYERAGFDRVKEPVNTYTDAYAQWLVRADAMDNLRSWDLGAFWDLIDSRPNRISARSRSFVNELARMIRTGAVVDAAENVTSPLRALIAARERSVKHGQSRLGANRKLLGAWSGSSAAGALTFRWEQVKRIVTDIHDGLACA